ncbi:MAG: ABC transporter permease subunit [Acidobacteriota bacterium]
MNFYDIRLLYIHELRCALRERGILMNSVLIPLFLYPVMFWLMIVGISFVQGQQERWVSRIALVDVPVEHEALRTALEEHEGIELIDAPGDVEAAIQAGRLDAAAELLPPTENGAGLDGNFLVRLSFDASKDRSQTARQRLDVEVAKYRVDWLERASAELGMTPEAWQHFRVDRRNVATDDEMGAFVLGMIVPMLMIIMIALGCFYPAVDATAGERERSTWETLMTVSASRSSVVMAKYLYVATLGGVAGLLNLFALSLSMRAILAPLLGGGSGGVEFGIPYAALPLMALSSLLLAMFIASGMMILAAFARTFKEGQSMIGPLYLLCILPPLLAQSPDLELTVKWALVPIVNISIMFREAIAGVYQWPLIGLTLVVQLVTVALCLALARWVLSFEDVLVGSYSGSFGRFLQKKWLQGRWSRRKQTAEEAS